ncbi:MAG: acyl-CoA dehydrogenase [Candidatus Manganitrophus sp.]|nr:acyl-CoA dehydrogenase [Candidatus Manganitrophus sp.]WDT70794.1 MAG: acyl-CoA dehydrogenase [Candidatus Manganitrophus sp.]WDT81942.1 MAG: acyl-CoA dehydrogenase [Candidatus Manganitrophus sp.]
MNLQFTEEQQMVLETVRGFAEKEVKRVASKMDAASEFPHALIKALGEMGLMGAFIPTEYGGSGMDLLTYILAMEEISKAWASLGVIMTVNNSLACDPINRFGTQAQKERYLVPLAQGRLLGCYALTEPGAGSDAGGIATQARRDGNDYVLNGTKLFITNGKNADVAIVYAVTDPARGKKGISAFIVEKAFSGFVVGKVEDKMGLRGSDTAELIFQECRVPSENLLGVENEGFKIALATLDGGRIGIAAQALGIAQGCLEESIAYAKERKQFNRPIGDFQAIQNMLADMKTEIDAARLLTHRAAWSRHQGRPVTAIAAEAKLYASEMANRVAYKAVQIFGGYGFIKDFPVERFYRDARITTLYEGTSEVQRMVIARQLLQPTS